MSKSQCSHHLVGGTEDALSLFLCKQPCGNCTDVINGLVGMDGTVVVKPSV